MHARHRGPGLQLHHELPAAVIDEDAAVLEAMQRDGGSFVRALANAARFADPENLAKIKATWPEYWATYTARAQQLADLDRQA